MLKGFKARSAGCKNAICFCTGQLSSVILYFKISVPQLKVEIWTTGMVLEESN